ncbi:MAG: hypothetical protein PVG87_27370, partial [Desulfobacteraceae bacterium]
CGDALGVYFSDVEISVPSIAPGSDPIKTLQSIEKLQQLNLEILFFSHGGTTREVVRIVRILADNNRLCADIALKALKAGKDLEEIANSLADVLVKGSRLTREDFLASAPYFIPATIEGYRQYFEKNMF